MSTKYSLVSINGVQFNVDPDTVSVNTQNLISVEKSMGGTTYGTYFDLTSMPTGTGYLRNISFSGQLLDQASSESLQALGYRKTPIHVTMSSGTIAGISSTANYIVTSVSTNPTKQRMLFPGETDPSTDFQYQYTISLAEV